MRAKDQLLSLIVNRLFSFLNLVLEVYLICPPWRPSLFWTSPETILLNLSALWWHHVCTARYNPLSWPGNTVTLTLWVATGQPPGWGHIRCVSAGLGVTVSSVWPQSRGMPGADSVRKLEAACVSLRLASREWGYPLSSGSHTSLSLSSECLGPG